MTRRERVLSLIAVAAILAAVGPGIAGAAMVRTANKGQIAAEMTRAPMPASGAWTAIATDNVAAVSTAALTAWTRYILQCNDDTYVRFGTAGSGQAVTSSSGWVPSGSWFAFSTDDTVLYVSALNKNVDSSCFYIEAR